MDPVSRDLDHENLDPRPNMAPTADLETRLGDLQVGGGGDMLIDDYDTLGEKQDVAIITPDESIDEPINPLADDYEAMKERYLPLLPDLEVLHEATDTWHIENYRHLPKKARGPKFECGGHPWRILLFPFGNNVDFASLYLEQGHDDDDKPPDDWYACVQFTLIMWSTHDPSVHTAQTANHRYSADESDWGFTRFAELRRMFAGRWDGTGKSMVDNDAVNLTAYLRIYKDPTGVLWHKFINYNSKKETGMVGLKNQGATCYLNSLLQSLYFTNAFRKSIFMIPTENETEKKNSAWALQRLFYLLQTSEDAVSTQELTASFGWETKDIFLQQDVQELSRILMERMEARMKGTGAENALARMFVGKMKTYISCINVDYESSRIEDYWDVQLNVRGNRSLDESFKDYIQVETMDGENKYFAEGHGLQDARKGVIFETFPQVLHLQLKRFEYDVERDAMMKVNDRYEFPEVFDAAPYLSAGADRSEPYLYQLHGVLVHSGDLTAGHYYAFLKPTSDGHFYKFDDDKVTRATLKEALEENYGGDYANMANGHVGVRNPYTRTVSTKRSMSAYMLVYIRKSREKDILLPVGEDDSPSHLARQLNEERAALERKRKDREEAHLYLPVSVVTEANFKAHQGFDLIDWSANPSTSSAPQTFRILRASTVGDFTKTIAETLQLPAEQVRLWVMVNRQNKTIRPDQPLPDLNMTMNEACSRYSSRDKPFRLWAESTTNVDGGKAQWPNVNPSPGLSPPILVFLKYFDADDQTLKGFGHVYLKKTSKVAEMIPVIQQLLGWSPGQDSMSLSSASSTGLLSPPHSTTGNPSLHLYEEIKHSMIEPMKAKSTLQQAEIQDGDIVCFQRVLSEKESSAIASTGGHTDAREYYDYLMNRIIVSFSPKIATENADDDFTLALSRKMSYDQFSAKVGERLKVDPTHLRFTTVIASTGKPKAPVRRNPAASLYQVLTPAVGAYVNSNQRTDALYYEILEMSLSELETKRNIRVWWLPEGVVKEEAIDILAPKDGVIQDLYASIKRRANLSDEAADRLRIYECNGCRISRELPANAVLVGVPDYSTLYAELIPEEERNANEEDWTIFAFHFDKEPNKTHGIPFKFVIKPGEVFKDTKERLSKRTGIKGKQFDKLKFAIMQRSTYARPTYLNDEDEICAMDLRPDDSLGLDHVNRTRLYPAKGDSIFIR
ncbi:MAG: hypothetical protein L6R37_000415 [Teloschistes peruensis]|nr:MAG: hypothetical protein L6R37_000415 [Teloschistes peruensis]